MEHRLERRIRAWQYQVDRIQKVINFLAVLRGITFLVLLASVVLAFGGNRQMEAVAGILVASGIFLYLMVRHDRCYRFKTKCELLMEMLKNDKARAAYHYRDVVDEHPIQFDVTHSFAHDLDLPTALLKFIDNSYHANTKKVLKQWIDNIDTVKEIRARQQAVAEMSPRKRLRLKIALAAHLDSVRDLESKDFDSWLQTPRPWTLSRDAWIFGRILSLITVTMVVLHFFFKMDTPWFYQLLLQLVVFYGLDRFHRRFYITFMERGKAVAATCSIIRIFEDIKTSSPQLTRLRESLLVDGVPAGPNLERLLGIHEMIAYRGNTFAHMLLNGLFMWDQHYMRKLLLWRDQYSRHLPGWVDSVFQIEAICALANFHWLFPGRPFPELVESGTICLQAKRMGHPAIAEEVRVGNDYDLSHNGVLHLITGSNMSGKSTFLRTIGSNLVLARMGAPVCAEQLRCSLPRLGTSIRIQDSLADGVSYFYAEVKRIKQILDEIAEDGPPVLYMLDEILKGTNSRERLIACKAMVDYLTSHRSSGLITTHDLELLHLARDRQDIITNYHFQERIEDDEMFFDYKLQPGELTSTNALRVMRYAGVPLKLED